MRLYVTICSALLFSCPCFAECNTSISKEEIEKIATSLRDASESLSTIGGGYSRSSNIPDSGSELQQEIQKMTGSFKNLVRIKAIDDVFYPTLSLQSQVVNLNLLVTLRDGMIDKKDRSEVSFAVKVMLLAISKEAKNIKDTAIKEAAENDGTALGAEFMQLIPVYDKAIQLGDTCAVQNE